MNADLHLHSNYSDGTWSPEEIVEHAVQCKLDVIALTDHDTVSGIKVAQAAARERIEIIPGVEINTLWHDDEGNAHDVHILGHFISVKNESLLELLQRQRDARAQQAREIVEKVASTGVPLTLKMIEDLAAGSPIGKPHMTRAIVAAGGASDMTEAYNTIYKPSHPYYVKRKSVTPVEAVEAIVTAGGVATIAHPGADAHIESMIRQLQKAGLDGIEVYHRFHSDETRQKHLVLASELDMIVTGGSDCHGPFEEHESVMGTMFVPPDAVDRLRAKARFR